MLTTLEKPRFEAPPIVPKPGLAAWMFDRDLSPKDVADVLGINPEQVRRWCRPFRDDRRAIPSRRAMQQIEVLTGGAVKPADFYPPVAGGDEA